MKPFRDFTTPDFQASTQPMMDWMPWEDPQQQGAALGSTLGSALGQLKPQQQAAAPPDGYTPPDGSLPYVGNGMPEVNGMPTGMPAAVKGAGGKSSL